MKRWPTARLGEVATIERDGVQPGRITSGTMYVGLEDIQNGGTLLDPKPVVAGELASAKFRFDRRHVLYGKLRPNLAKIACPDFEGICSTDIVPIAPGPELDRRYLLHFLRQPAMVAYASSRTAGINLPRLSPAVLETFEVPLPPLPEQRRIADILDRADALRAKRRAAIALLDTLTQAIFRDMFGGVAVTTPKLSECAEVVSGVTKGRKFSSRSTVTVPYLRVANVQAGYLNLDEIKTIEVLPNEVDQLRLLPGDVVMTEGGDFDKLGRGATWEGQIEDCIHQNHVFRVRVDRLRLTPAFFHDYLQTSSARNYFLRCAKRTTNLASINMTQLKALPIPLPPLDLQHDFARRVAAVEQLRSSHRRALATLNTLFAALQHRAFRGEL